MSEDRDVAPAGEEARAPLVRYQMMAILMGDAPLPAEEFASVLAQHAEFVASGGSGGHWTTLVTDGGLETGIIIGVYRRPGSAEPRGEQAKLSHKRLDGLSLQGVQLSYADLSGVSCRDQNLEQANLQGSLMVDSDFSGSCFGHAVLRRADLSRADLAGCDFREADLRQADFENADLAGADFTGARTAGARFPGARMDGARGLGEPAPKPPRLSTASGGADGERRGPASRGTDGSAGKAPAGDHGRRPA